MPLRDPTIFRLLKYRVNQLYSQMTCYLILNLQRALAPPLKKGAAFSITRHSNTVTKTNNNNCTTENKSTTHCPSIILCNQCLIRSKNLGSEKGVLFFKYTQRGAHNSNSPFHQLHHSYALYIFQFKY
ncbi:predicted protein [Chaetoceros tenuissimus]|uniref:Uncharacterized protein n=1 Tax=Chaetoceros tenuissimus TaxID=426638 RepID=A0AAD3CX81_9STRA|nr:predicted protein [Chaetoceros tenuissimus]